MLRVLFTTAMLAAATCLFAAEPNEPGFVALIGKDTNGWIEEQHDFFRAKNLNVFTWSVVGDVLKCNGSYGNCGFLRYEKKLCDFILRLEYRMSPGCNSGVGLRSPVPYTGLKPINTLPSNLGYEFQIMDDAGTAPNDKSTGSFYAKLAPSVNAARPAGEWNSLEIECRGPRLRAVLNGQTVQDVDHTAIPALADRQSCGYLSLQNHGHDIEFRRIRLLEIKSPDRPERVRVTVRSTADGQMQPCYVITPPGFKATGPRLPLMVSLHSWSGDVEQRSPAFELAAEKRGWLYLFPNFRGINKTPAACGSALARQDILDAVAWAADNYPVDRRRIYLTGVSGGGHMTMLMAGRHPGPFAAASSWVGLSDLATWQVRHRDDRYGESLLAVCGGPPGASAAVDHEYRERSPLHHLAGAVGLPLDIAAGVHDGHTGSVPVRQSLDAFNVVAQAQGAPTISAQAIEQISRRDGRLAQPESGDTLEDPSFGRAIYLRRQAGKCRVTIFEGGHEGIAEAACAFLERHIKPE